MNNRITPLQSGLRPTLLNFSGNTQKNIDFNNRVKQQTLNEWFDEIFERQPILEPKQNLPVQQFLIIA